MTFDSRLNEILLFGGLTGSNTYANDLWAWNGATWTQLSASGAPSVRDYASFVSTPTASYLFGGQNASGNHLADMYRYDGSGWTALSSAPAAVAASSAAWDPSLGLLEFAGGVNSAGSWTSSIQAFDPTANQWSTAATLAPTLVFPQMIFDPIDNDLVLFFYDGTQDETWSSDSNPDGTRFYDFSRDNVASPLALSGSTPMAYDASPGVQGAVLIGADAYGNADTFAASHIIPTITNSTTSPAAGVVGGSTLQTITVGNPSRQPMPVDNVVDTLPAGFNYGGPNYVGAAPGGTPCTTTTTPSCTLKAQSLILGGFTLPANGSSTFTLSSQAQSSSLAAVPVGGCNLAGTTNTSEYTSAVLADSPEVYYRLDDAPAYGSGPIADASGHGNTGTYSGQGGDFSEVPGATGDTDQGIVAEGLYDSKSISTPSTLSDLSGGFSFEEWTIPGYQSGDFPNISLGASGSKAAIALSNSSTGFGSTQLTVENSAGTTESLTFDAPVVLALNKWAHMVLTVTATGRATLYVNGVEKDEGQLTFMPSAASYSAGETLDTYQGYDDFAIYNHPLSAASVIAHYAAATTSGAGFDTASVLTETAAQYPDAVRDDAAFQYLRLDDASPNTAAADTGYLGTYPGAYQGLYSLGAPGPLANDPEENSVSFPGTSAGSVQLATSGYSFNDSGHGATVELWAYPTSNGTNTHLFEVATASRTNAIIIGRNASNQLYYTVINGTTATTMTATATTPSGSWSDIALTIANSGASVLYRNGVSIASSTATPYPAQVNRTSDLLGSSLDPTVSQYAGRLSEYSLYLTALTAAQLARHYAIATGLNGQSVSETAAGQPSSPSSPLTICDAQLGRQPWWSFASQTLGSEQEASANVASGNLLVTALDSTEIQARGHLAYSVQRAYNSQDSTLLSYPDTLGSGWNLSLGQGDDVVGDGIGATALSVPDTTESLSSPADVTLIDRSGARMTFTPKLLSAPLAAVSGLLPRSLPSVGSGNSLCVDEEFTAPAGVHLSLWRYVKVTGSSCSGTEAAVVGYGAEQPNRLRFEFAVGGELLDMTDGAGVEMRYLYSTPPALGTVPSSSELALGPLRVVYEPLSCKNQPTTTTNPTLTAGCRGYQLTYSGDTGSTCPVPTGDNTATCLVDPASRKTIYGAISAGTVSYLTTVQNPDGTNLYYTYAGIGTGYLPANLSSKASTGCGPTGMMCQSFDARGNVTAFSYAAPTGGLLGPDVLASITDRAGIPTTFTYASGYTDVDTAPNTSTSCLTSGGSCERTQYSGIDGAGRVGQIAQGTAASTSGPWLHLTTYAWDKTGATCRTDGVVDNDLCSQTSQSMDTARPSYVFDTGRQAAATPNRSQTWTYDPAGDALTSSVTATSSTSLTTAYGYHLQYVQPGGGSYCVDYSPGSGGAVTASAGTTTLGCTTTGSIAGALFLLSDHTSTLSPNGSAAGSSWQSYLTNYQVDDLATAAPNTYTSTATYCSSPGAGTSNTGMVCEQDTPAPTGSTTPPTSHCTPAPLRGTAAFACSRYTYDAFGAKLTYATPKENATASGTSFTPYAYTYYADWDPSNGGTASPDSNSDVLGDVDAGGWLKSTTDPNGNSVVFAYDRAGNKVYSWDRNAFAKNNANSAAAISAYPYSTGTTLQPYYTETQYGPGDTAGGANPFATPWRYPLETLDEQYGADGSTALNYETQVVVDANGNVTLACPAREFTEGTRACSSGNTHFSTATVYDARDEKTQSTDPLGHVTNTVYDGYGNTLQVQDPNGFWTVYGYDAVNRQTTKTWDRTTKAAEAPATCAQTSASPFPSGAYVCQTSTAYDGLDDKITMVDGNGNSSYAFYDGAGRQTATSVPRSGTGSATVFETTATVYDADGNKVVECTPRQFDTANEPGAADSCTSSSVYATQTAFDPADKPTTVATHRSTTVALTALASYDADGNVVATTDRNGNGSTTSGHTTNTTFDFDDRKLTVAVPRSGSGGSVVYETTAYTYDPSGNELSMTPPAGGATDYSYDGDNRVIDTITGVDGQNVISGTTLFTGGVATGTDNDRTRKVYDAAGDVTGIYSPNAFGYWGGCTQASGCNPVSSPDPDYMTTVAFDADDRASSQSVPRADNFAAYPSTATDSALLTCPQTGTYNLQLCTTSVVRDADGNVTQVNTPDNAVGDHNEYSTTAYTDDDLPDSEGSPDPSQPAGTPGQVQSHLVYDADGKVVSATDPLGRTTTTQYTLDELAATVTEPPNGNVTHVTTTAYNAAGMAVKTTDGVGNTDTTSYTADGLPIDKITGANDASTGHRIAEDTHYVYDNNGNAIQVWSPSAEQSALAAGSSSYTADPTSPAGGKPTVNTYTADNLVLTTTVPTSYHAASPTVWCYRVTTQAYDGAGRKQTTTTSNTGDSGATTSTCPNLGLSDVQSFTYAPNNTLTSQGGRGGGSKAFAYDPAGEQLSSTDSTSNTTTTTTYYLDGLTRGVFQGTAATAYAYNGNGDQTSVLETGTSVPNTMTVGYNDADLPVSEAGTTLAQPATWAYDQDGEETQAVLPNQLTVTNTYAPGDGTLTETKTTSGSTVADDWTYVYDGDYRVTSQSLTSQSATLGAAITGTYSYSYDAAGRVASFTDTNPNTGASRTRGLTWDHDGNRTGYGTGLTDGTSTSCTASATVTCATYNPDDTIQTSNTPTGTATLSNYSYDQDGRLSSDTCEADTYDAFDRLAKAAGVTGATGCGNTESSAGTTYTYDALDRKISSTANSTNTEKFSYYGDTSTIAEDDEGLTAPAPGTDAYTEAPDGTEMAVAPASSTTSTQYLTTDGQGNDTTIFGATNTATPTCTVRFDPFGSPEIKSGQTNDLKQDTCNSGSTIGEIFYKGGQRDSTTQTYQYGARTYNPASSSFKTPDEYNSAPPATSLGASEDPLTQDNYTFVNGDPVNFNDPTGHGPCDGSVCAGTASDLNQIETVRAFNAAIARATAKLVAQLQQARGAYYASIGACDGMSAKECGLPDTCSLTAAQCAQMAAEYWSLIQTGQSASASPLAKALWAEWNWQAERGGVRDSPAGDAIAQLPAMLLAGPIVGGVRSLFADTAATAIDESTDAAVNASEFAINKAGGAAATARAVSELVAQGHTIVATGGGDVGEITFNTVGGAVTRADIVSVDEDGNLVITEVKLGNATLSAGQTAAKEAIEAGEQVIGVGGNAAKAGLSGLQDVASYSVQRYTWEDLISNPGG